MAAARAIDRLRIRRAGPRPAVDPIEAVAAINAEFAKSAPRMEFRVLANGDVLCPGESQQIFTRHLRQVVRRTRQDLGLANLRVMASGTYHNRITELELARQREQERDRQTDTRGRNLPMEGILREALDMAPSASDIYIDVHQDICRVSYRVNGIKMPPSGTYPPDQGYQICNALWNRGGDSFEEGKACDTSFSYGGMRFRGNSEPTIQGADVVLRLRDPSFFLPLDRCGYSDRQTDAIKACVEAPGGMILLTGDTNSGKSSTLATLLGRMPDTQKIIELSDPVEIIFDHVTQIEINRDAEDADRRLREILSGLVRQNPDSLVLGEIRDEPTVRAATEMALQGKRVLTTLHASSCLTTFPRLEELGVDKTLIYRSGFIAGVVNQALVPVLCEECRVQGEHPDPEVRAEIRDRHARTFGDRFFYASGLGCAAPGCRQGLVGQTLVAEVFPMTFDRDGEIVDMLAAGRAAAARDAIAREWGMESKQQHAYMKIMAGECDPHLVERRIGRMFRDRDSQYPEAREL